MRENRLEELEQTIGYRFRQPELLVRALTHRSAVSDGTSSQGPADNEQLEYLGDAVLGMIVSEHLIETFTDWSEGQLSKSRARLVNASSLCAAARRLNLGNYLRLGKGEENTGGREKPALLSDALEAADRGGLSGCWPAGGARIREASAAGDGHRGARNAARVIRQQIRAAGVSASPRSSAGAI